MKALMIKLYFLQATCLATTPYCTRSPSSLRTLSEQFLDHQGSQVGEAPLDLRESRAPQAEQASLVPMGRTDNREKEVRREDH